MKRIHLPAISIWLAFTFLMCNVPLANGQQNLIRNHSFEAGTLWPRYLGDLEARCNRWRTYETLGPGSPGSADWFKGTPHGFNGTVSCHLVVNENFNIWPLAPVDDGVHYAGIARYPQFQEGEGIQQQFAHALEAGYYTLDFDYLLPCDTQTYALDIYFGAGINHCTYLALSIPIPTTNIGQWQNFNQQLLIPSSFHHQLDWFIVLNSGQAPYPITGSYGAYIYLDDFHLRKSPCTACDPNGLISWNDQSPRGYLTPNGDHVFDEWCVTNINNVSWYEFFVFDRWGGTVYNDIQSNANGFENLSLCWDGRNNNGQMLQVPNIYNIVVRLGNCGTQITRWYGTLTINDLSKDTFSIAQNYVPPLFGLEPSPTHYRTLHLYGGPYYGQHDWYACDSIIVAGDGAPRVPYFWAASTSNLGMYASDGIFIDSTADYIADFGADVEIDPRPVQCCPQMRLANPEPSLPGSSAQYDSLGASLPVDLEPSLEDEGFLTMVDVQARDDSFRMEVVPNPAMDLATVSVHVPDGVTAELGVWNASGIQIQRLNNGQSLSAGDHEIQFSVKVLPAGLYYLLGQSGNNLILKKIMVMH